MTTPGGAAPRGRPRGRRRTSAPTGSGGGARGRSARQVALAALDRIDAEGAYANLVLPQLLRRSSDLSERDRRFATDLVYGTTRQRRACDFLLDRFLSRSPSAHVRNVLRLGAYQLAFGDVPPHAAVAETVALAPRPARGLVNAVLRRVAEHGAEPVAWPDDATRLSYPDWIVDRLTADLGPDRALSALAVMNEPAEVTEREDGYIQDAASQQVAAAVGAQPGDRILDACAAPGGKSTAMAATGAWVVAADVRPARLNLVRTNAARLMEPAAERSAVVAIAGDGTQPPWRGGAFDRALVDAPCSGLGTLRRRADLRWRVDADAVDRLADLQRRLVTATVPLLKPRGVLVYSVCTLTSAESLGVDDHLATAHPELAPLDPPGPPWEPWGRGAVLLPQTTSTDGMTLFRYQLIR